MSSLEVVLRNNGFGLGESIPETNNAKRLKSDLVETKFKQNVPTSRGLCHLCILTRPNSKGLSFKGPDYLISVKGQNLIRLKMSMHG